MSTIWSIPVGVLLVAALFIFLINRAQPNIGASWFAAITAGLFVWGWTISLYFRPGFEINPLRESVPGILEETGIFIPLGDGRFILDGISYPYMLAISSMLVVLLLTAPSYMDPQTAPVLWIFFLLIEAIGYLSISANNVTYFIYGWIIFDGIDLISRFLQSEDRTIPRGFLTAIGIRFIGTLLAAASLALSNSELAPGSNAFISLRAGPWLLTACALRMGILPISQPYSDMSSSRVGLGAMLRLVSILTVMPVLSRIPLGGLRPDIRFILGIAGAFAALAGSVGWLLSENAFSGISYAALGICGMALNCALSTDQIGLVAWGISIALTCAPLSLYQIHNRLMNLLGILVILCFSGLPYTPNAIGWFGLVRSPNPLQNILYILIPMLLIAGAFIHILRTEGRKFSDLEPWMRSVYPLGFLSAIGTHVFIGVFILGKPYSMGIIPASAAAFGGGVLITLIYRFLPESSRTQNTAAWGRAGLDLFWSGMRRLMDMNWLLKIARTITGILNRALQTISLVLEDNGGLVWEFLLLALLIVIAFSGVR